MTRSVRAEKFFLGHWFDYIWSGDNYRSDDTEASSASRYNDRLKIWCLFTNKENGRLRNNINKENFKKKFSGMKRHLFDIIQILFNGVPFLVKDIGPHEREPQVELLLSMQSSGSEGRWDQK